MKLTLRHMSLADIPQVMTIDRHSFELPWSEYSYSHEITESTYSHMVVLEKTSESVSQTRGWRRWIPRLNGHHHSGQIVGYGGLWNIMSEAHISTIAVHPDYRGRGCGEILLAGMVAKSIALNAGFVVLEVRVSNRLAQNLYGKYDFQTVGIKNRYYRNNNEDAYDMRLGLDSHGVRERFAQRLVALHADHDLTDRFSSERSPYKKVESDER
jgi:ribosomal-protein-alanine N-acetyltransferase